MSAHSSSQGNLANHTIKCLLWLYANCGIRIIIFISVGRVAIIHSKMLSASHAHTCHVLVILEAIDFLGLVRGRACDLEFLLQFLNLSLVKFVFSLKLIVDVRLMLFMYFFDLFLKFLNLLVLSGLRPRDTCLQIIHFRT